MTITLKQINWKTSAGIRWEAFNVSFGDKLLVFVVLKVKNLGQELQDLEKEIKELENEVYHSDSMCADKHKQLLMLRSKYNTLSANKTVAKLLKAETNIL